MAAPKKWNTHASTPKKRVTSGDIIIFSIIAVIILISAVLIGGAMDEATVNGKVNTAKLGQGFSAAMQHPGTLLKRLAEKGSNVQKMVLVAVMGLGIFVLYKFSIEPKRLHRHGEEHGSARWGTPVDAKRLIDPAKPEQHIMVNPETGERLLDESGQFITYQTDKNIILSNELKMSLTPWMLAVRADKRLNLNLNILVLGTSGSGKTRYVVLPNACQLNTSYVFTDPKGEIKRETARMFMEAGYKIKTFNLIDMAHSNNYNPYEYVFDENGAAVPEKVEDMTRILFNATKADGEKEDFWSKKGEQTLKAFIFLQFEQSEYDLPLKADGTPDYSKRDHSKLNYTSLGEKLRMLNYPPKGGRKPDGFFLTQNPDESDEAFESRLKESFLCEADKEFMELNRRKPGTLAYKLYHEIRNAPEETGQSFLSSANVRTFPFNFPAVVDLTCCDNIHLETLGDEKTVLYIITSTTSGTYDFLATMMYSQLFDTLSRRANFKYDGALPVHVRFIMDEFANLGEIPNFEKIIAVVRSMGMSLVVILQTLSQLKAKYEKSWETITGCCSTTVFLGGAEESTIKSISERLGKETIDITGHNRTRGRSPSTSENNSIAGRELMQPDELASMPSSDCIIMIAGLPAFYNTKYQLEQHPNYRFLELSDASRKTKYTDLKTVTFAEIQEKAKGVPQKEKAQEITPEQKVDTSINFEAAETPEQEEPLEDVFESTDLLSILRNPPKLHIKENYADAPINRDIYDDPLALPADIDPNLMYPNISRKEDAANGSDKTAVTGMIDMKPVSDPLPEDLAGSVVNEITTAFSLEPTSDVDEMGDREREKAQKDAADPDSQDAQIDFQPMWDSPGPDDLEIPEQELIIPTSPNPPDGLDYGDDSDGTTDRFIEDTFSF